MFHSPKCNEGPFQNVRLFPIGTKQDDIYTTLLTTYQFITGSSYWKQLPTIKFYRKEVSWVLSGEISRKKRMFKLLDEQINIYEINLL